MDSKGLINLVGGAASSLGLLADPATEESEMTSDRTGASASVNAAVVSQQAVAGQTAMGASKTITDDSSAQCYDSATAAVNPGKLIEIGTFQWGISQNDELQLIEIDLPSVFFDDVNKPGQGQARRFKYTRTGFHFRLMVNASPGAAGALVMYYLPRGLRPGNLQFNSIPMAAHAILNIGTTSEVEIIVPYVAETNYVETDGNGCGSLVVAVWAKMTIGTDAAQAYDCTVLGACIDLDFQNPRPQGPLTAPKDKFKKERLKETISEGMNSMNLANCRSTQLSQSIALAGENAMIDPATAGSECRQKDLVQLTAIPTKMTTFTWQNTQSKGAVLLSQSLSLETLTPLFRLLSNVFKYTRGSIVLRFTVFGTPLTKGRLKISWYPNQTTNFTYAQSQNSQYVMFDIGLQDSVDFTIPYAARTWLRSTRATTAAGEPPATMGWLNVFVQNPLTRNSASASTVRVVVTAYAGPDFELYSPDAGTLTLQGPDEDDDTVTRNAADPDIKEVAVSENTETMAVETGLTSSSNDSNTQQVRRKPPKYLNYRIMKKRIFTVSHTRLDNLLGRAHGLQQHSFTSAVAQAISIFPPRFGIGLVHRLYTFFQGTVNVHVANQSGGFIYMCHQWNDNRVLQYDQIVNAGAIVVPPNGTISFTVPWYNGYPVKNLFDADPLGTLKFVGSVTGNMILTISMTNPNFFWPTPIIKQTTARTLLDQHDLASYVASPSINNGIREAILDENPDEPIRAEPRVFQTQADMVRSSLREHVRNVDHGQEDSGISNFALLALAGDVESNPGPVAELVYKDRGLYRHYGIRIDDIVYQTDTEDIVSSMLGDVKITCTIDDNEWISAKTQEVTELYKPYLESLVNIELPKFSWDHNCETWARNHLPDKIGVDQGKALKIFSVVLFGAAAGCIYTQAGASVKGAYDKMKGKLTDTMEGIMSSKIVEAIGCTLTKNVCKMVIRIVCYGILFCSSPNLLTGAAVASLVAMDLASIDGLTGEMKALCKSLVEGDLAAVAEAFSNIMQVPQSEKERLARDTLKEFKSSIADNMATLESQRIVNETYERNGLTPPYPENQGLADFNIATLAAKNVQWWLDVLKKLFTMLKEFFAPSDSTKAQQILAANEEDLASTLSDMDDMVIESKTPGTTRKPEFHKKWKRTATRFNYYKELVRLAGPHPLSGGMREIAGQFFRIDLKRPIEDWKPRMDPLGIWINGPARQGKSFLLTQVVNAIKKFEGNNGRVYAQPSGSDHLDGYDNQDIHVIDDLGQCTDEKDIKLLCQYVSSMPFPPPMADLDDKGMMYTSKVIVATTNREEFVTTVLTTPEALNGRFPIKIYVEAAKDYQTAHGRLNVTKALDDDAMVTGACWDLRVGFATKPQDNPVIRGNLKMVIDLIQKAWRERLANFQTHLDMIENQGPNHKVAVYYTGNDVSSGTEYEVMLKLGKSVTVVKPYQKHDAEVHFVNIVSRAGTDIQAAVAKIPETGKTRIVVVLHHTHDKDYFYPVSQCIDRPDLRFVDVLWHEDLGCMVSGTNARAIAQLQEHIRDISTRNHTSVQEECNMAEGLTADQIMERLTPSESPFTCVNELYENSEFRQPKPKILAWIKDSFKKFSAWVAKYKNWFIALGAISSAITTAAGIYTMYRAFTKDKDETTGQRPYAPVYTGALKRPIRRAPRNPEDQGPLHFNQYAHLGAATAQIYIDGVPIYGIGLHGHTLLTYGHSREFFTDDSVLIVQYAGREYETQNFVLSDVDYGTVDEPHPQDLLLIEIPTLPWQFKSMHKYIARPTQTDSGIILWAGVSGSYHSTVTQTVTNVEPYFNLETLNGTKTRLAIHYDGHNHQGMCGGMVIQQQQGSWKIIGMHIAGNRFAGYAASLEGLPSINQGIVEKVEKAPTPVFTPTRTKLEPSPLYGVWEVQNEPAALTSKDKRLQIQTDNLTKFAAGKYRVNTFTPTEEYINEVKLCLTEDLYAVTGMCKAVDLKVALNGVGALNKIDMSTSPGTKYVREGLRKKDLILRDTAGNLVPSDRLQQDVEDLETKLYTGELTTDFTATLKDELRPKEKIAVGKSRCIEACSVDYVAFYRQLTAQCYSKIYNSPALATGIAVGINPYTDFHDLVMGLDGGAIHRAKGYTPRGVYATNGHRTWYAIDYSRFDGSLSEGLMRAAVDVLAAVHEDPEGIRRLHEPVIVSRHLVSDEVWTVRGGMPSGSPCTSVLNSICNIIVVKTALMEQGVDPRSVQIVTYGDDVLFSVEEPIDSKALIDYVKNNFGMEMTTAMKDDSVDLSVDLFNATFLKRKFVKYPGTNFYVGQMDLQSMQQHIMWMKGPSEFEQQLDSFLLELSLHGPDVYNEHRKLIMDNYPRKFVPTYKQALDRIYPIIFY